MPRTPLSKRLRFAIFDRDKFQCRYCGRQPDSVVLVVDHIQPVSKGGTDDPENLITSCQECNQGKAAKIIGSCAPSETDRLRMLQEYKEQAEAFKAGKKASKQRKKTLNDLCQHFMDTLGLSRMDTRNIPHLKRMYDEHGNTLFEWMEMAALKGFHNSTTAVKYIYGIRRKVMEEQSVQ